MYLFPVYLFTYFLFTCLFTYFLFTYLFTFNGHTPLLSHVAGLCTSENCKNHVVGLLSIYLSIYYLVPFSIYLTSNVGVTLKIQVRDRLRWWIMVSIDTAYVTSY